jgi:site-specific DNA recombinase
MIAAIYARKSTEQNGLGDEEKSVTRQIEHAKAYATKKGWAVAEDYVYVDDGISGAEFVKRPGFLRLMNALKPKPAFQVLIMSEESRLGREQIETAYALKQIMDAGVRVFFYLEDRERTLDSAMDKVMLSLTNFAAEMERERARQRTHDALLRKAKALQVPGGAVYGYDNLEVPSPTPGPDGRPKRQHVIRRPNPEQAAVVQRIFELYASGFGITRIAKRLNAEHIPPPRRDRIRHGWAPTAIRAILHRELYRGVVIWNRTQKITRGGTRRQRRRPEADWLSLAAPELRIISDNVWNQVRARMAKHAEMLPRIAAGRLVGRPAALDGESPYLLTGFTRCTCGGAIGGTTQFHGTGPASARRRVTFYGCALHRKRGPEVCGNDVVLRQDLVDPIVLGAIRDALDERVVDRAVDLAFERLQGDKAPDDARRSQLDLELAAVEQRIQRGLDALLDGIGVPEELQARLREEKARKQALTEELERLRGREVVVSLDAARLKRDLAKRVNDMVGLLSRHTAQARQVLRRLLVDKIDMLPVIEAGHRGYRLSGRLTFGRLLQGEAAQLVQAGGNSRSVVAPYLKALRRSAFSYVRSTPPSALGFSARPDRHGPCEPHVRPRHRGPVSSEPYLRRLSGMMVISGMSQSTVELPGAHGASALIPVDENGLPPSVRDRPPLCSTSSMSLPRDAGPPPRWPSRGPCVERSARRGD